MSFLVVAFARDPDHQGSRMNCDSEEQAGEAVKMLLRAGAVYVHVDNLRLLDAGSGEPVPVSFCADAEPPQR